MPSKRIKNPKQKILILGARGMLGSVLCDTFSAQEVFAWDRKDLDICDEDAVKIKITQLAPKIIINAAAYTDVDGAEKNKSDAFRINSEAVRNLASAAFEVGAIFVHYSTDYIFSGTNPLGYKEDDKPGSVLPGRSGSREGGPQNMYGLSKLRGEEILQELAKTGSGINPALNGAGAKWYLIRTSWLYGPGRGGKNFVKTIYNLAKENKELKIVNDQHGKPTYTKDLAQATQDLIYKNFPSGIYHLTNETETRGITWFEFAKEIIKLSHFTASVIPTGSNTLDRPAKRPQFSLLVNSKFQALPDWKKSLEEYIHDYLLSGKDTI